MPETREGGRSARSELWRRRQLDTPPQYARMAEPQSRSCWLPYPCSLEFSAWRLQRERSPSRGRSTPPLPQPSRCTCAPVPALQEDALRAAGISEKVQCLLQSEKGWFYLVSLYKRERGKKKKKIQQIQEGKRKARAVKLSRSSQYNFLSSSAPPPPQ